MTCKEFFRGVSRIFNYPAVGSVGHFRVIKNFHPSGKETEPNGSIYQRGGYFAQCAENMESFIIDNDVASAVYGNTEVDSGFGGVIVLPKHTSDNVVSTDRVSVLIEEYMCDTKNFKYDIGNCFTGSYIDGFNIVFGVGSLTIQTNGLSSHSLLGLASYLTRILKTETILVRDFNKRDRVVWVFPKHV